MLGSISAAHRNAGDFSIGAASRRARNIDDRDSAAFVGV